MHAQSCPTLCNPMVCSPPSASAHGISQARILESVAISYSRGSSPPKDRTSTSCTSFIARRMDSLPLQHLGGPLRKEQQPTDTRRHPMPGEPVSTLIMPFSSFPREERPKKKRKFRKMWMDCIFEHLGASMKIKQNPKLSNVIFTQPHPNPRQPKWKMPKQRAIPPQRQVL